ncbi:MAG TPA: hypothetical protein VKA43_14465 [Gammaproteobacteria bacterium]|nr:hypothetical protein [Gammaproteobacteria bacterium]
MPLRKWTATALRYAVVALFVPVAVAEDSGASRERLLGEDRGIEWGIEGGLSSGYAWRGITISDAPVTERAAWVYASGFSVVAWQSLARSDTSDHTRPRVTNLFVAYEHEWRKLRIEPSLETFRYRDSLNDDTSRSTEAALKVSYTAGPLLVFALYGVDISAHDGASYVEAGIAHERWFQDKAYFEIALRSGFASAKFNEANIGIAKRAVNFVGVDGSLTYYVRPHFYIRPHLELSDVVDDEVRAMVSDPHPLTLGIAVGVEF